METFLWCLIATIGWFGLLAVIFLLGRGNSPDSTICHHCAGRGYTLDEPLADDKKKHDSYLRCLKSGYIGTK